ncbi:taste receptor type 2 member 125-like [Anomaloglossus baeobatrachus]|uniref:taste receptor type 2 member 125-like n=1 Tax=Anomaloglossus baeobatrachus TaxID=238106 RepID=UPI003F4F4801
MKTMYNGTDKTMKNNGTETHNEDSSTSITSYEILSLAILMLETIIGTFMNGLMVIVNLISLLTHRRLGSCDSILTCLGLSRFSFMWLVLVIYFISYLAPDIADRYTDLQYTWLFFNSLSLWLATWLSTFYCVRLVNIERYLFTAFKTHFDRLVPFLISISVSISLSCSNSGVYDTMNQTFNMSKFETFRNETPFGAMTNNFVTYSALFAVGSVPPFLVFCVSAGLVVNSLLSHMKNLKSQERSGFREPSLDAHWRAIRMMGAFFMFFFFYLLAFNLYGSGKLENGASSCIAALLIGAYPSVHSVLLVIGNHKLKHALLLILQKGNCYHKEVTQTISD